MMILNQMFIFQRFTRGKTHIFKFVEVLVIKGFINKMLRGTWGKEWENFIGDFSTNARSELPLLQWYFLTTEIHYIGVIFTMWFLILMLICISIKWKSGHMDETIKPSLCVLTVASRKCSEKISLQKVTFSPTIFPESSVMCGWVLLGQKWKGLIFIIFSFHLLHSKLNNPSRSFYSDYTLINKRWNPHILAWVDCFIFLLLLWISLPKFLFIALKFEWTETSKIFG